MLYWDSDFVLDLARLVAELSGRNLNLRFAAPCSRQIRHSLGSPVRIRATFDLPKAVTLRTALANC
jgi:hypothetical protein